MRILLLGELSGVHQELHHSLRDLGHDVVVGHSRLAYPGFDSDIPFFRPTPGANPIVDRGRDILSQLFNAPRLTGFDIVQLITPKFFDWRLHTPLTRFLKAHNRRLVVINTSCTSDYHRRMPELAYSPCAQCKQFDLKSQHCLYDRDEERRAEALAFDAADAIVATHYEYGLALADTRFADKVVAIPLPIDTRRHRPAPLPAGGPIRIWYGETRHGFKGGASIRPALDRLAATCSPEQVEIVRTARLAFDDYLAFLDTVHIVVDQANSFGAGMNALYALARGRVTLSGAEPETLAFYGISASDNPLINIRPDPDDIYRILATLVSDRAALDALGRRSAAYVERFHAASVIARQYVDLYDRLLARHSPAALLPFMGDEKASDVRLAPSNQDRTL
jgi:glycosyltransferase involved in cell wall biosynthesis